MKQKDKSKSVRVYVSSTSLPKYGYNGNYVSGYNA